MEPQRCFKMIKEMECISGDTLDEWVIEVTTDGEETVPADISGCTMQLILCKFKDDTAALTKACTADEETGTFSVILTSEDTARLNGLYTFHFELCTSEKQVYKKIAGLLNVVPQGGFV